MNHINSALSSGHIPVMIDEVLDLLVTTTEGWYVDGTVGAGGHTAGIVSRLSVDGRVLGIDLDTGILAFARERLSDDLSRVVLRQGSYAQAPLFLQEQKVMTCQGVLLDLGLSSYNLEKSGRGFSYQVDEPLDMRFDPNHGRPLREVLPHLSQETLAGIISRYGEDRQAKSIARAIHTAAAAGELLTTRQLAETVKSACRGPRTTKTLSRVFQALRIFVNDELNTLQTTLERLGGILGPGGRAVIISYHSLEDRLVKQFFIRESRDCLCPPHLPQCICGHVRTFKVLTDKPVRPSHEELARNPRSRSSKLRAVERL